MIHLIRKRAKRTRAITGIALVLLGALFLAPVLKVPFQLETTLFQGLQEPFARLYQDSAIFRLYWNASPDRPFDAAHWIVLGMLGATALLGARALSTLNRMREAEQEAEKALLTAQFLRDR